METTFKKQTLTRQQVLDVLADFRKQHPDTNEYEEWLDKESYKYVLVFDEKMYPPKHILSQVTGIPTTEFSGGNQTNRVFEQLGFKVVLKDSLKA
jgi:5-methylcytosine-specific restriction protein A